MEKHHFLAGLSTLLAATLDKYWDRIERLNLSPKDIMFYVPSTLPASLSVEAIEARWSEIVGRKDDPLPSAFVAATEIPVGDEQVQEPEGIIAELLSLRPSQLEGLAARAIDGKPETALLKFVKKAAKDQAAKMTPQEQAEIVAQTFYGASPNQAEESAPAPVPAHESDKKETVPDKPGKRAKKSSDSDAETPKTAATTASSFADKQRAAIEEKISEVVRVTETITTVRKGTYTYSTWESCNNKVSGFERDIDNWKAILYPANSAVYEQLKEAYAKLEADFDSMPVPEQGSKPLTDLSKEEYVGLFSKVDWKAEAIFQNVFDGGTEEDDAANLVITKVYWFTKTDEAIKVFEDYMKAEKVTLEQFADWVDFTFTRRDREPAARTAALVKYLREDYFTAE